jgi:hypothetical protein
VGRALENAENTAHPAFLNARFAYVKVSRARLDIDVYANNTEDLMPRLATTGAATGESLPGESMRFVILYLFPITRSCFGTSPCP